MSEQRLDRRTFVRQSAALVGASAAGGLAAAAAAPEATDPRKTRSFNENMEYRRLGRTGLWLSVLSMGGHWKRIPFRDGSEEFKKNRR